MKNNDDKPVGDWPNISANQWETWAIVSAILSAIGGSVGIFWMLGWPPFEGTDTGLRDRAQAFTAMGAFMIAIVTFCTVSWRAKVNERQVKAAEAQLASADENNLVLLLQKGSELLSDTDEGKIATGIACLEAVVTAERKKYGNQAMRALGKYIESKHGPNLRSQLAQLAQTAIASGISNGNTPLTNYYFKFSKDESFRVAEIQGAANVVFYSGKTSVDARTKLHHVNYSVNFATIENQSRIDTSSTDIHYIGCNFIKCNFLFIDIEFLMTNKFAECNFSGCNFHFDEQDIGIFREFISRSRNDFLSNSFYFEDDPPTSSNEKLMMTVLDHLVRKPAKVFNF